MIPITEYHYAIFDGKIYRTWNMLFPMCYVSMLLLVQTLRNRSISHVNQNFTILGQDVCTACEYTYACSVNEVRIILFLDRFLFFCAEIEGLPEENVTDFLWSRINCCHITYHEIVSVEAYENSQHQCPVLDHNHPHTKQAVQRGQVCFWAFDSTFHLCIEMPLNSVLPHVLHNWRSASNWQCHSSRHQRNIKFESSDGSVNHNRKKIWRW